MATEGLVGFCDVLSRFLALLLTVPQARSSFKAKGGGFFCHLSNFQHFEGCVQKKYQYRVMTGTWTNMLHTDFSPAVFHRSQEGKSEVDPSL